MKQVFVVAFYYLVIVLEIFFEFANNKNSIIFNPKSEYSIKNSLQKAMLLSKDRLKLANKTSEFLGKKNNYDNSYRQFVKIITKCLGKNYAK